MANTLSTERHDPQSPADWRDHITRYEYVIVHHTVPEENFAGTIEDIWGQTGADPNDPDTWDRRDIIRPVGMVEMYHYQSTRNNRQHAKLCEAFRAIRSTDGLAVSIERVGFKSPGDPTTRIPRYWHDPRRLILVGQFHVQDRINRFQKAPLLSVFEKGSRWLGRHWYKAEFVTCNF